MKIRLNYFNSLINDEDALVRDTGRFSFAFLLIGTVASFPLFGLWGAVTFFSGALVMLLNFIWLKELITLLTGRAGKSKKEQAPKTLFKFLLRYILLGIFLYVIITVREVEEFALLLGLSVLVAGVFAVSIRMMFNVSEIDKDGA